MQVNPEKLRHGFTIGDRLVQPARSRINGPGGERHVEPRVMSVLLCLAERPGEVVSRNTLYDAVWDKAVVSDQALTNCISELRRHLGDDRAEPRYIETVPKRGYRLIAPLAPATSGTPGTPGNGRAARRSRVLPYAAAAVLVVIALVAFLAWRERGGRRFEPLPSVVSTPFENVNGEPAIDYLRLALPDEITTLLTQSPELAVRPFEAEAAGDPAAVARAREVGYVVTGHYYLERDERLAIAVEALDVEHERLVWRARITVPADDLLALREKIAARVRRGLLPALGASTNAAIQKPSNADAYRLYLHSLAVSRDAQPNLKGIEMLEQAVRLDPGYSPGWAALAARYHADALYGNGGDSALRRSRDAALRALEEDPATIDAAQMLIVLQTEAGELVPAYRRARELVDRRHRSADAHYALAFVLRYAGMLDAAQRHCDIALVLDPHNYEWRSCALAFLADGEPGRAAEFVALDPGSYWSNLVGVLLHVSNGDRSGALRYARALPPDGADRTFLVACLEGQTGPMKAAAAAFVHRWRRLNDPEPAYHTGAVLAWCGRTDAALRMLRHAIEGGYCAYPAVDRDPIWRGMRETPEFRQLREEALACHQRFRTAVVLASHS